MSVQRQLRVLLVDEDARIVRALAAMLREFEVHTSAQANGTTDLARQHDVDVVVCEQRLSGSSGTRVLQMLKQVHPRAMRILVSAYPDGRVVTAAINEAEVFRFIARPWDNAAVKAIVTQAAQIAAQVPALTPMPLQGIEFDQVRAQIGIMVIGSDVSVQQRLREILQPYYKVYFANTAERAVQTMEQHEIGVVVCDMQTGRQDLIMPMRALKQSHPHIAVVLFGGHVDLATGIGLINAGQIFRLLGKPVQMGSCRLSVDTALARYWWLKRHPQAARRLIGAPSSPADPYAPSRLPAALLGRIQSLPGRVLSADND